MRRKHRIIAILLAGAAAMVAVVIYSKSGDNADAAGKSAVILAEDLTPANLGQLRYFTSQATKYLDWKLKDIGGAGPAILRVLDNMHKNKSADSAPVTLGQLEEAAQPFYDRLRAIGFNTTADIQERLGGDGAWPSPYPWNPSASDAAKLAAAQVGQLKFAFGFDLIKFPIADDICTNKFHLPDKWIVAHGLDPFNPRTALDDPDGDGLCNLDEYLSNSDPNNPDTDGDGVSDGTDAVPFDARFKFERAPVPQYAMIDLGPGTVVDTNEDDAVLIRKTTTTGNVTTTTYRVWYQGSNSDIPSQDEQGNNYAWARIGGGKQVSGIMLSGDGKTARPARWKPGDVAPTVLTEEKALLAMPDLDFRQPHGETPTGPDHVYIGPEGIYLETIYYQGSGKERNEEATLLLWDNRNRIRVVGDALGSGLDEAPKTPPKQSILLASAPETNLVYEITGENVPVNSTGWRTTALTAQLLLNGKTVPGSQKTARNFDLMRDVSLGDLPRLSNAQNLTHPVVPDFFGNHTLYMDPGGSAPLVAVDWPAAPGGKGVVKFSSINAVGIGVTPDGKEWIDGSIHAMSDLSSGSEPPLHGLRVNQMANNSSLVTSTIASPNDKGVSTAAHATSRVVESPPVSAIKFEGVIPFTSALPRCAPTYPAATRSVVYRKPTVPMAARKAVRG